MKQISLTQKMNNAKTYCSMKFKITNKEKAFLFCLYSIPDKVENATYFWHAVTYVFVLFKK